MNIGDIFMQKNLFEGTITPRCLWRYKNLSLAAKAIWSYLPNHTNDKGICFVKQDVLAEELSVSISTIKRAIEDLEKEKFIKLIRPSNKNKFVHKPNGYVAIWPKCFDTPPTVQFELSNLSISNDIDRITSAEVNAAGGDSFKIIPRNSYLIRKKKSALHQKQKTKREVLIPKLKKKAQYIFDYWKSKGLYTPKDNSRGAENDAKKLNGLVNGTIFTNTEYAGKEISIENIKLSIDRLANSSINKISVGDFIYAPFMNGSKIGRSRLVYFSEHEPKQRREMPALINCEYPVLVAAIKKRYIDTILGGLSPPSWSTTDENHFRFAASRLVEFFTTNKKKIIGDYSLVGKRYMLLAEYLLSSITTALRDVRINKVQPSWLSSDTQFNKRLPAYLHDMAILRGNSEESRQSLSEPLIEL